MFVAVVARVPRYVSYHLVIERVLVAGVERYVLEKSVVQRVLVAEVARVAY